MMKEKRESPAQKGRVFSRLWRYKCVNQSSRPSGTARLAWRPPAGIPRTALAQGCFSLPERRTAALGQLLALSVRRQPYYPVISLSTPRSLLSCTCLRLCPREKGKELPPPQDSSRRRQRRTNGHR